MRASRSRSARNGICKFCHNCVELTTASLICTVTIFNPRPEPLSRLPSATPRRRVVNSAMMGCLSASTSTMSIEDVLADKQPIIAELTTRLRGVAEGSRESGSGLGLKIVTVQIKEAVVSSTQLWQNLQMPFRADRERVARMAELETQQQIDHQGQINRQQRETAQVEIDRQLSQLRHDQDREQ